MVTKAISDDSRLFRALSDPIRREIIEFLYLGDRSAGAIAARFLVSRPAVSRHLRVLREAGLLSRTRLAQSRIYALNTEPLARLDRWLSRYRARWTGPAPIPEDRHGGASLPNTPG